MEPDNAEYPKPLSDEEAARKLHGRNVAIQMKMYQRARSLRGLAMLTYGSDKVFDHNVRSLGVSFVTAYLAPPEQHRDVNTALAHCSYLDHTNGQTAAILMANLLPEHVAQMATALGATPDAVEDALMLGIAELLNAGQLMLISAMAAWLSVGTFISHQLRDSTN